MNESNEFELKRITSALTPTQSNDKMKGKKHQILKTLIWNPKQFECYDLKY